MKNLMQTIAGKMLKNNARKHLRKWAKEGEASLSSRLRMAFGEDLAEAVFLLAEKGYAEWALSLSSEVSSEKLLRYENKLGQNIIHALMDSDSLAGEQLIRRLLEKDEDVLMSAMSRFDGKKRSVMHVLCEKAGEPLLKDLLKRGAASLLDLTDWRGETPLAISARRPELSEEFIRQMIEKGANPKARDSALFTPLHRAAENGAINALRVLAPYAKEKQLKRIKKAIIEQEKTFAQDDLNCFEFDWDDYVPNMQEPVNPNILAVFARESTDSLDMRTPAAYSAMQKKDVQEEEEIDVVMFNQYGSSPLYSAANAGQTEACRVLIEEFLFDVNEANASENSPLHAAVFSNKIETAKYLLSKGASPDAENTYNLTPATLAFMRIDKTEDLALFFLRETTANLNVRSRRKGCAIEWLLDRGSTEATREVLASGKVDLNKDFQRTRGPFEAALLSGRQSVEKMELLETYGVGPSEKYRAENATEFKSLPRESSLSLALSKGSKRATDWILKKIETDFLNTKELYEAWSAAIRGGRLWAEELCRQEIQRRVAPINCEMLPEWTKANKKTQLFARLIPVSLSMTDDGYLESLSSSDKDSVISNMAEHPSRKIRKKISKELVRLIEPIKTPSDLDAWASQFRNIDNPNSIQKSLAKSSGSLDELVEYARLFASEKTLSKNRAWFVLKNGFDNRSLRFAPEGRGSLLDAFRSATDSAPSNYKEMFALLEKEIERVSPSFVKNEKEHLPYFSNSPISKALTAFDYKAIEAFLKEKWPVEKDHSLYSSFFVFFENLRQAEQRGGDAAASKKYAYQQIMRSFMRHAPLFLKNIKDSNEKSILHYCRDPIIHDELIAVGFKEPKGDAFADLIFKYRRKLPVEMLRKFPQEGVIEKWREDPRFVAFQEVQSSASGEKFMERLLDQIGWGDAAEKKHPVPMAMFAVSYGYDELAEKMLAKGNRLFNSKGPNSLVQAFLLNDRSHVKIRDIANSTEKIIAFAKKKEIALPMYQDESGLDPLTAALNLDSTSAMKIFKTLLKEGHPIDRRYPASMLKEPGDKMFSLPSVIVKLTKKKKMEDLLALLLNIKPGFLTEKDSDGLCFVDRMPPSSTRVFLEAKILERFAATPLPSSHKGRMRRI